MEKETHKIPKFVGGVFDKNIPPHQYMEIIGIKCGEKTEAELLKEQNEILREILEK